MTWKRATFMRLVDTSAWVEFLRVRGNPPTKRTVAILLQDNLTAYTCPIHFELLSGVRPQEEASLREALDLSHHIVFGTDDWRYAAFLERTLRAAGLTIPRNDLFVATVAIRTGLPLVCRDAHFTAINQAIGQKIKVEHV
jgi:predicted nucleic acid-binding protein